MATHGTDQTIVQRLLAARNQTDSRRAILASGFIVLFQFTVFLLVGALLFVFAQHTPLLSPGDRTDRVLPLFLVREMPTGLVGILLASILAVAMSNASGSLNSLSASSVLDLNALRGRAIDPTKFLKISRRMTLVWGTVLIFFGLVKWQHSLLETGLAIASLPFGSLLGLFLLGTLDSRANSIGSLAGMFAGLAAVLTVYLASTIAYTWYVLIGSCVTFLVGALVSRIARRNPLP
jgi:Na+/proline symporter